MKSLPFIGVCVLAMILITQSGCALITTKTVAMAAGQAFGKMAYKEIKEKKQEDQASKAGE